jgi:hypothetical protein
MIQAIVEQKKPTLGEKGQYGYVRKPEEKPKRSRKRKDDGPGAVPPNDDDFLQPGPSHQLAMAMHMSLAAQDERPHPGMLVSPVPVDPYPQGHPHLHNLPAHLSQIQAPTDGPVGLAVRKSADGEKMEDEEAEWDVKVGNDPPPLWGKRKIGEDPPENGKRARVMFVSPYFNLAHNISLTAPNTPSEETNGRPLPAGIQPDGPILHVVDQSILDIAREFRFTVEEVQEYYDRCGAMDRTRARFKKMRDTLLALPEDDSPA